MVAEFAAPGVNGPPLFMLGLPERWPEPIAIRASASILCLEVAENSVGLTSINRLDGRMLSKKLSLLTGGVLSAVLTLSAEPPMLRVLRGRI